MTAARDLFDAIPYMNLGWDEGVNVDGVDYAVSIKISYDFEGGGKHLAFYIPEGPWADCMFAHIMAEADNVVWSKEGEVGVTAGMSGHDEKVDRDSLVFTRRVTVYTDSSIPRERWDHLIEQTRQQGITLIVRDPEYAERRQSFVGPPAFISHDSRDKDAFVRPLAEALRNQLCPLWYDEYSLVAGASLRESIERGLKECGKCVLVLSPNFFENGGWTRREFETIYQREVFEQKRVIVPIWLNVTKQDVYDYSPVLLDTVGISADLGTDDVARRVMAALNFKPPHPPADRMT